MTNTQLAQRAGRVSHVRVRVRTSAQDTSKREASPSRYSAQHTSKRRHHFTCLQRTSRGVTYLCTTHVMGSVTLLCTTHVKKRRHVTLQSTRQEQASRAGVTLLCTAYAKRRSHITLHNICQMEASRTVSLHNTHHEKESRHYINRRQGESSRHYINTSAAASGHYISIQQGKSSRHYTNRRQRHDTTLTDSKGRYHETTLTHGKGSRHDSNTNLSSLIDYHYSSVTTFGLIHGKAGRHDTTLAHSKGSRHDIRLKNDTAGRHDYINTRQRQVVTTTLTHDKGRSSRLH